MANFEVFQCGVCNRKIEKQIDQNRATISKCTITHKCVGNLVKVSSSDSKTMLGPSEDPNLVDWIPRGTIPYQEVISEVGQFTTLNSSLGSLSIAIEVLAGPYIDLVFEVRKLSNATFTEYHYSCGAGVVEIFGQDDSSKRIALRFTSADQVIVYVSGVQLKESEYSIVALGRIRLNSPLIGDANQIKIIVYKQAASSTATLRFLRNSVLNHKVMDSAWGNITQIGIPKGRPYSVYSCYDVTPINLNSQLSLKSYVLGQTDISDSAFGFFLLADEPFTGYDRNLLNAIPFKRLVDEETLIEYKNNMKQVPTFTVDIGVVKSMVPPVAIIVKVVDDIKSITKSDTYTKLTNTFIS